MKMKLCGRAQGKVFIAFFLLTVLCVTVFSCMPPDAVITRSRAVAAAVEAAKGAGLAGDNSARFTPDGPVNIETLSGDLRLIVILVEFTNIKHETPRDVIHNLVFVEMNRYWLDVSYSQFNVTGDTVGWIDIGHDEAYYGKDTDPKDPGSDQRRRELIADACRLAEGVDFENYQDIMVVFAGQGQDSDSENTDLIWPRGYRSGLHLTCGGRSFDVGGFSPETEKGGGLAFGTLTHEFGHSIGLPDLYNRDPDAPDYWETEMDYVGLWSLMGYGSWGGPKHDASSPVGLESWSRIRLGWLSSVSVPLSPGGFVQPLNLLGDTTDPRALKVPATDGGYYLFEARGKVGVDRYLPSSGVLITRVDESKGSGEGIVEVMDCHPGTKSIDDATCGVNESWSDTSMKIYLKVIGEHGTGYLVALASEPVTITMRDVYTAELSLMGLVPSASANVTVDGTEYTTISGADKLVFLFPAGSTHIVALSECVITGEDMRYCAAVSAIRIAKEGAYLVEYDVEEFRLLVETDPSSLAGVYERWLVAGESHTLGPYDEIVPVDSGTRYFFVGLVVDGVQQETMSVTLHMDQPHAVAVRYVTQYFLKVVSDFGEPKGEGWYAAGDVATYSVKTPCGFLIRHVFASWTGDIASIKPHGTLTMTRPYNIEARWRDDYTQLLLVLIIVEVIVITVDVAKRRAGYAMKSPRAKAPSAEAREGSRTQA